MMPTRNASESFLNLLFLLSNKYFLNIKHYLNYNVKVFDVRK